MVSVGTDEIQLLARWRDQVLDAFTWGNASMLDRLALRAISMSPSAAALDATGDGKLLSDASVWAATGTAGTTKNVAAALEKWKRCASSTKRARVSGSPSCLEIVKKPKLFKDTACHFLNWLQLTERVVPACSDAQNASFAFAIRGFEDWRQLEGLSEADLLGWSQCSRVQAMIVRAVRRVNSGVAGEAQSTAADSVSLSLTPANNPKSIQAADASAFALSVTTQAASKRSEELLQEKSLMSLTELGESLRPQEAISRLEAARDMFQIRPLLSMMVFNAKFATNLKSSKSVASGLRAWHGFATKLLDYDKNTLPPRRSPDVQGFCTIFRSAGTAANYVGYISWACRVLSLDTSWRDEEISMVLKGTAKLITQKGSRLLKGRVLLDDEKIRGLVGLADKIDMGSLALAILTWYEFLLRPLSEALVAFVGEAAWKSYLPSQFLNGLWIQDDCIFLRLACRKHRQSGSLLVRRCTCGRMQNEQFCLFHRFGSAAANLVPGDVLWKFDGYSTLAYLRSLLKLLKVENYDAFTWKGFRAGKATAMTAAGDGVGEVLAAGEWRSRAFLAYIDEDTIDKTRLVHEAALASDDDDDDTGADFPALVDQATSSSSTAIALPVL